MTTLPLDLGFIRRYKLVMSQRINESVSVSLTFDSKKKTVHPKVIVWSGRLYAIKKVGLHHTVRRGKTLFHVFSVVSGTLFFRLVLDTSTLHWVLEEISDGF